MKIVTVVGARPQFIKAGICSAELRKNNIEVLVHTGQHYDQNMSEIFFEELSIPKPDYNLGISGGTHAQMTGKMLEGLESLFFHEKPDAVLVYGDTNSTLAAALAAVKIHIPIIHVEAGNRFGTLDSPEEVNRILTDHISTLRFACTESALNSLKCENLEKNSFNFGDPMYDAFLEFEKASKNQKIQLTGLNGNPYEIPDHYYYMTCHRQENTDNVDNLLQILNAMESLDYKTIYPVHPRNQLKVKEIANQNNFKNILFVQPVGYLESIKILSSCVEVVTDSGGLQREAFFAKKKCVTVLDFIVWPETMHDNRNELAKPNADDIVSKLSNEQIIEMNDYPFGDGNSAKMIANQIDLFFNK